VERLSDSTDYAKFTYGLDQPHGYNPYGTTQAMLQDIADYIAAHTPPPGQPDPDLSATRGNRWEDVSANSCATRAPAHPAVAGDTMVGSTLTADPGAWDSGMALSYQWKRDGAAIDGATGSTYTTATADIGHAITVAVTGAKLGYDTTTVTSDPVTITIRTAGATGQVGGAVAPTLSLTLGGAVTFGAFTPGVAKEYLASADADVISTAGDAALTVADAGATAPGHLANGTFSLPKPLQARTGTAAFADVGSAPLALKTWTGPVSNERTVVDFRQAIGDGDALRTGSYAKTLTFTLATTNP
jgi:hypothetical protein